jgi:NADP-dependent 3-hydroxy acid dehydrogenase YdfG
VRDGNEPNEDQCRKRKSTEHEENGRRVGERAFRDHHAGAPDQGNEHAPEAVSRAQPHASRSRANGQSTSWRLEVEPTIDPAVVARAVIYMASLPLDANVQFMTVMATKMPYVGRG